MVYVRLKTSTVLNVVLCLVDNGLLSDVVCTGILPLKAYSLSHKSLLSNSQDQKIKLVY